MRAQEGTEDKVLRSASRLYQSKGLPPVAVHVLWHPNQALRSRRIPELTADLTDLVLEHLPEPGHEAAIRRPHPAWRSLPQEVASLWVDRRINFSKNAWTSVRGAFVPMLTPSELQKLMRDKEAKVSTYRRQCREVWLLIVARGFEPSTFGDFGPEVEVHRLESDFDRVFFLHHANEYVAELHVRPVSEPPLLCLLPHRGPSGWGEVPCRAAEAVDRPTTQTGSMRRYRATRSMKAP